MEDVLAARRAIVQKQIAIEGNIKTKKKRLGVKDQEILKNLMGNKFLQLKLNATALKQQLRAILSIPPLIPAGIQEFHRIPGIPEDSGRNTQESN